MPDLLAEYFSNLADDQRASIILVDGPQGWKDPNNGLAHSRRCEKSLNTPAKTGLPGNVKPANYRPFVQFSIMFFDELARRCWPRLRRGGSMERVAVETFPLSAWRSLGLRALPAKAKTTAATLQDCHRALLSLFPTRVESIPSHDELQALIAGLAGLAMVEGNEASVTLVGESPFLLEGAFRVGRIVCPTCRPQ